MVPERVAHSLLRHYCTSIVFSDQRTWAPRWTKIGMANLRRLALGWLGAFRTKALWSGAVTIVAGSAALLISGEANVGAGQGLGVWIWTLRMVTLVVAAAALAATRGRFFRAAQVLVVLEVAFIVSGWGAGQYPYLLPPDITIYSAAAPHATLWALTLALAGGALVLFPSFYYLFYVFKGNVLSAPKRSDR
jgi:cytochrome bd-type quinol oxidase subunit 2